MRKMIAFFGPSERREATERCERIRWRYSRVRRVRRVRKKKKVGRKVTRFFLYVSTPAKRNNVCRRQVYFHYTYVSRAVIKKKNSICVVCTYIVPTLSISIHDG